MRNNTTAVPQKHDRCNKAHHALVLDTRPLSEAVQKTNGKYLVIGGASSPQQGHSLLARHLKPSPACCGIGEEMKILQTS